MDPINDLPLGAFAGPSRTFFRIFAPNAARLTVRFGPTLAMEESLEATEVIPGFFEAAVARNLAGQYYAFSLKPRVRGDWRADDEAAVLDPYALATAGPFGPGLIFDRRTLPRPEQRPVGLWSDQILLEGHLADLLGLADRPASYSNFTSWLAEPKNYLTDLGVTALELQPLTEMEEPAGDYAWGYMPTAYFAPTHRYADGASPSSSVAEFARLVEGCHRRGLNLVLDVVYNHMSNRNSLRILGGDYFFRRGADGQLTNHSGCGNDFRTEAPMARKLIIDSLRHWVEVYGVDGFRFDLAELIDLETLRLIEDELKKNKPSLLLIAEPWSFHGHNALALRETGWSAWNDDFRNYVMAYLRRGEGADGLRYFLAGSTAHRTRFPTQTVNYTACHDDRTWIDGLTEVANFDGSRPTDRDIRRTRLMFAILFMALGIPMVAEGQDFCHSKGGQSNTYRSGHLNRLGRDRLIHFGDLHAYVRRWIAFRRSAMGRLLRHETVPPSDFFHFIPSTDSQRALAVLYNASGEDQLLFCINPEDCDVHFDYGLLADRGFRLQATEADFFGLPGERLSSETFLPPLSCRLFVRGGDYALTESNGRSGRVASAKELSVRPTKES